MNKLKKMSDEEYHGRTGEKYITSGLLKMYRKSPQLFLHRIKNGPSPSTPAMEFGTAFHSHVLTPDEFESTYIIGGPINDKTRKPYAKNTKVFKEWRKDNPGPLLSYDEFNLIKQMTYAIGRNLKAYTLLCASTHFEHVIEYEWKSLGVTFQAKPDAYDEKNGTLVDIKTCADLDKFGMNVRQFEYVEQQVFYAMQLEKNDYEVNDIYFIAVEKAIPYRCGVFHVSQNARDDARSKMLAEQRNLFMSMENNNYPSGYEITRIID